MKGFRMSSGATSLRWAIVLPALMTLSACASRPAPLTDTRLAVCRPELAKSLAASERPAPPPLRPIEEGESYRRYMEDYLIPKWAQDVRALRGE